MHPVLKYSISTALYACAAMAQAYPVDKHLSVTLNVDAMVIDPEVNNTTKVAGNRASLLTAYGGFYGIAEYTHHPATNYQEPFLDDYSRFEVGLSLDTHNNLRVGFQTIPKWDLVGYRVRGLHNLNYGFQVEPWLGFMKSTKKRPAPLYNSSTTSLGVTVTRNLFRHTQLRFGYETNLTNKHTSYDYGFVGLSIGLQ